MDEEIFDQQKYEDSENVILATIFIGVKDRWSSEIVGQLDTGSGPPLCLPANLFKGMHLDIVGWSNMEQADGSSRQMPIALTDCQIAGRIIRQVPTVLLPDGSTPLIGLPIIRMHVFAIDGDDVYIEARPPKPIAASKSRNQIKAVRFVERERASKSNLQKAIKAPTAYNYSGKSPTPKPQSAASQRIMALVRRQVAKARLRKSNCSH